MAAFEITIAGEINLDLILYGLPESLPIDREILAPAFRMTSAAPPRFSLTISHPGVRVGFITRWAAILGAIALELLRESGVDLSRVVRTSGGTQPG